MRRDWRQLKAQGLAAGLVLAALLLFIALAGGLIWSILAPADRLALTELLAPRVALLVLAALAVAALAAALAKPWVQRWVSAPYQLLEQAQVLITTDVQRELSAAGAARPIQELAPSFNVLTEQRDQLKRQMAEQVAAASRGVEQERNRLAALMSELTQSVVVCNLDGRILLYNNRARLQFRALSSAPSLADGAELIGLGRSVYQVFDTKLVAHALDSVQQRLARGAANPSAQFVTVTRTGQLLRVQLAPVRSADAELRDDGPRDKADDGSAASAAPDQPAAKATPLSGFVLMLENITREQEQQAAQERLLHGLTEGSRGALANLQAAVEMLDDDGLDANMRERFLRVARAEATGMARRINELAAPGALGLHTRWPLEDMLGADFIQAASLRMDKLARVRTQTLVVQADLWLKLDSYALLQALVYLAGRLRDEYELKTVQLRLEAKDSRRAHLDLVWTGQAMSTETVMSWEMDAIVIAGESAGLTVREVVARHGGEFWFERDRPRHQAFFRFLLPQAPTLDVGDSRPEFYDFDLFAHTEVTHAMDDRRLADLSYTVFDTETTGLNPSQGDEIIQVGATRVVNGKVLRGECFDQLVDPQLNIPAATIPIHGITPDMVAGQPTIAQVLPAFHAFAQDTVLVAHNAAFDMRFLQLKEAATGLRFDHPVLDTLLLSALVHPNQASHRLEAIAERFNVTVVGRHTALGDAMVTAEVFQKLVPLLAEMGIHTLGEAREVAQKTYYARLKY